MDLVDYFFTLLASLEQEDDLEELVMTYSCHGFPFTDDRLCILAYELAKQTNIPGFSPVKKKAGKKWLKGFMKRKPNFRKKNAQNLSAASAISANPAQVQKFFQLLVEWVRKWKIEYKPNNIWNVDETGLGDVQESAGSLELLVRGRSRQLLMRRGPTPLLLHLSVLVVCMFHP